MVSHIKKKILYVKKYCDYSASQDTNSHLAHKWGPEMESKEDEDQLIQTIYGKQGSENRENSTGQAN